MIDVFQATADKLEDLAHLFNEYRIFYKQASDVDGARSFLSERLNLNESVIFIAVDDTTGQAAGFTQLYPSFSSVSMQRLFILNDLYVRKEFRGQGAGRRLLEAARGYAASLGAKGLELSTAKDNVMAQSLYEQFGYEKETEFYHYFLGL